MEADGRSSTVVTLTRGQCLARLAQTSVGRLGLSIDALPSILPIRFTISDESVLFVAARGSRLESATTGAVVAFQADGHDPEEGSWWSVLVQGVAKTVGDHEAQVVGGLRGSDWSGSAEPGSMLRLGTAKMSGRLFPGATHEPLGTEG